jgi:hypothetical protein
MKTLEKTVVIKGGPQSPDKAPVAPVPAAKGAPVAPPPMWNYEGKPGASPPASGDAAATPEAPSAGASANTAPARDPAAPAESAPAAAPGAVDEEQLLALLDAKTAIDQMDVEIAAFAELVSRLPE